jgi:hypothetical protein
MDRRWLLAHGAVVLALVVALAPPAAAQPAQFANVPIQQLWQRYDLPVAGQQTTRSWTWGPSTLFIGAEPYVESPGGQRVVQYFDKSRMELNDPSTGVVTNGLLVRELVSGRLALGDIAFEQRVPSTQVVAGDPVEVNPSAVSYADFAGIASIDIDRRAPNRIGQVVNQGIDTNGHIVNLSQETLDRYNVGDVRYAFYEPTLGHNMPSVFLDFVNQRGTVYVDGEFRPDQPVFEPWTSVMGLPITEPYWTRTLVGGQLRILLVQLFERRALTYTPTNPDGFKVEMGNVGQHYFTWRTQPPPPPPAPPPPPPDAPVFTEGPLRTALSPTSATIEWRTSEPTTSFLDWDTDSSRDPFRNRSGSGGFRTTHSVTLTGLAPNVVYFWRVVSTDRDGQPVPENNHSFRTPPTAGGGTFISSPSSAQRVTSPLTVTGQEDGTAFESGLVVRLRDTRTGFIYAQVATTVQGGGPGRPGPFSATLVFTPPATDQPAAVEVVSFSPVEGEPEQLRASVNVTVVGSGAPPPPSSGNTISRPFHNNRVGAPLRVVGTVDNTVVGGNLVVQIRDVGTGQVLGSTATTANSRGEFNALIDYTSPSRNAPGVVEVIAPQTTDGRSNVIMVSVQIIMA